jgi:hypothetical protein
LQNTLPSSRVLWALPGPNAMPDKMSDRTAKTNAW